MSRLNYVQMNLSSKLNFPRLPSFFPGSSHNPSAPRRRRTFRFSYLALPAATSTITFTVKPKEVIRHYDTSHGGDLTEALKPVSKSPRMNERFFTHDRSQRRNSPMRGRWVERLT